MHSEPVYAILKKNDCSQKKHRHINTALREVHTDYKRGCDANHINTLWLSSSRKGVGIMIGHESTSVKLRTQVSERLYASMSIAYFWPRKTDAYSKTRQHEDSEEQYTTDVHSQETSGSNLHFYKTDFSDCISYGIRQPLWVPRVPSSPTPFGAIKSVQNPVQGPQGMEVTISYCKCLSRVYKSYHLYAVDTTIHLICCTIVVMVGHNRLSTGLI